MRLNPSGACADTRAFVRLLPAMPVRFARPAALLVATLALSACGTTGGGANGWAAPRSGRTPAAEPARTASRPAPRRTDDGPVRVVVPGPDDAAPLTSSGLLIPVVGIAPSALRDSFTSPRSGGRTHNAIDIMAPTGTPLVATTDGTVRDMRWNALGGRTLYLRSADGRYDFYYAHLDSYADGLAPGTVVRRGDRIGTVGTTGNARGPHLHLQVLDLSGGGRGTPVNPFPMYQSAEMATR